MSSSCVQYVTNKRLDESIISGLLSPTMLNILQTPSGNCLKAVLVRLIILFIRPPLYTDFSKLFNLLNKSFTHNPQYLLLELKNEY